MSLQSPQVTYDRTVRIIKKGQTPLEGETLGNIINGDLDLFVLKVSTTNTTTDEVNHMKLDLRIDPDGTFIRSGPILIDEEAKDRYLIDVQITQTLADGSFVEGRLYRFEISQAIIREDEINGEILQVVGRGQEWILKENYDGSPQFLQTPASAFAQRLLNYAGNPHTEGSGDNPFGNTGRQITIELIENGLPGSPDFDVLKRDWIPSGPQPIFAHLKEIIDKVALPAQAGGVLTDFFWDAIPNPIQAEDIKIIAQEFGGVDSGVIINPEIFQPAEQKDKQLITDSKRIKNHVILKGQRGAGTLPMGHARFNSEFTNSRFRPDWDPFFFPYSAGALVKIRGDSVTDDRFFRANLDHISNPALPPDILGGSFEWTEDFKIDNFTGEFGDPEKSLSQWTRSRDDWITNLARPTNNSSHLAGANPVATPNADQGYVGYCVDWNFVRGNYDRSTFLNFDHIAIKWVTRISNTPPTQGETFDGQRILVGTNPSGVFQNQADRVAEFDAYPDQQASGKDVLNEPEQWRFSRPPQDGDIVSDLSTGIIMQYDSGWKRFWSLEDRPVISLLQGGDSGQHSWFHLVKEIGKVKGPSGSESAIRFIYDWRVSEDSVDGGNQFNRTSRGVWMNFWFPFPRLNTGQLGEHENIGHEYGGVGTRVGTLDLLNLTHASNGLIGWNRGLTSEDLGAISALKFKFKVGWETGIPPGIDGIKSLEDGVLAEAGYNDEKFTCFFVDKFDRVSQFDFTQRRNGSWSDITIPIGAFGNPKIYVNRINEFRWFLENSDGENGIGKSLDILSATGQRNDFALAEKEFTGVAFDWRAVKMWGIQWAAPYGAIGNYVGMQFASIQDTLLSAIQEIFDFVEDSDTFMNQLTLVGFGPIVGTIINGALKAVGVDSLPEGIVDLIKTAAPQLQDIDRVTADIDEIRFIKDLYANSDEVTVKRARTHVEYRESEFDYLSARRAAQGVKARLEFYPQNYTTTSFGDVRVRVGQLVTISGERVPTLIANHPLTGLPLPPNTQVGVVKSVEHIVDERSYTMRIELVRKFILGT